MVQVSLLVRRAAAVEAGHAVRTGEGASSSEMSLGQALRSPQFIVLLLTNFFCCATHSGPIIHTVSYAVSCGIPLLSAVTIYSVEGLAGMGGRIAFGLLRGRFGAQRLLGVGFLAQAVGAPGLGFRRRRSPLYFPPPRIGFLSSRPLP